MAIHWNAEEPIAKHGRETIMGDHPDGGPVTDCLTWFCLIVGIDVITDRNVETVFSRIHQWETITGPLNTSGRPMEPRDIVLRVGFRTNASRMTDAQWRKKVTEMLARKADEAWRYTAGGMFTRQMIEAERQED